MAGEGRDPELAKALDLFPKGQHKLVIRLLDRALQKSLKAEERRTKKALRGGGLSKALRAGRAALAAQLASDMRHRGASKRTAPSIRMTAPDTGRRTFHFAHDTVNRTKPPKDGAAAKGGARQGPQPAKQAGVASGGGPATGPQGGGPAKGAKPGKSAAHHAYIERAGAVERASSRQGLDAEGPANDVERGVGRGAETAVGKDTDGGIGAVMGGEGRGPVHEGVGPARAAQSYIENPVKLATGEAVVFSFGAIG